MTVMATDLSVLVERRMRTMPIEDQQKVADFVEELANPKKLTLMEKIEQIASRIPEEDLEKLPVDGAVNVDHYLYGHPKKVA